MIKTILIDDEENSLDVLELLLNEYCPMVRVLARCRGVQQGIEAISSLKPDLLFLDIEMPNLNGFDLLERIQQQPIAVIFTTAFHHYAIKAIKYSALDYLLKPLDPKELIQAVNRFTEQKNKPEWAQLQFLMDKLSQKEHTIKKLAIPNLDGFRLISVDEIIACVADDNYTHILLKNKSKVLASRTLKEIQNLLSDYEEFIRVHHSSLINLKEVNQYIRGEGGYVIMSDGSHVNVSRNKKEALLKYLTR